MLKLITYFQIIHKENGSALSFDYFFCHLSKSLTIKKGNKVEFAGLLP